MLTGESEARSSPFSLQASKAFRESGEEVMILISIRKHNLSCSRLAVRYYVVRRILNDDKKILMRNELAFVFWGRWQRHDLGQVNVNTFSKLFGTGLVFRAIEKKIALGYASNRFMTCSSVIVQFLMRHRWAACFLFIKAEALDVASHEHPSPSALLLCVVAVVFLLFFLSRYFFVPFKHISRRKKI